MELIEQGSEASSTNRRFIVRLDDGSEVEAVAYRGDTLCISSQVGCAVACPFCASGANGLGRSLGGDELRFQIEAAQSLGLALKRVTLSGVGEPLHNHAESLALLAWVKAQGLGLSLTTSGGPISRLREWLHAPHNGLTVSVHAGTEETRARMVPKGPTLDVLFAALAEEQSTMTRKRKKKTALAYLLVRGQNDADGELDAFAERLLRLPSPLAVHLYDLNRVPTSPMRGVERARYEEIYGRLTDLGLQVRMSSQARLEENGGCGTLVALRRRA